MRVQFIKLSFIHEIIKIKLFHSQKFHTTIVTMGEFKVI